MGEQTFTVDVVKFDLARFGFAELEDDRFLAVMPVFNGLIFKDSGNVSIRD